MAELKSCSERYMQQICKQGKIECISEISIKNRTKFMIPVSALSEDLQTKYYRQKRIESGVLPEKNSNESKEKTAFKYRLKG
ncbi:MAG: hypothetical protein K2H26_07490, partial [Ruminococcus sp.]|nr:hypothetical protein [Ruminococcus sp.]